MAGFFQLASAIFTRIMFLVHGFVSVYLIVESQRNDVYWWLCIGLVFLIVESVYTIIIRKGKEYKYFWPGSLLYMLTVLPVIWVAEMSILRQKNENPAKCALDVKFASGTTGLVTIRDDTGTTAQKWSKLGLILVIIIGRWLLPRGELTRDQLSALLLVYVANAADIMELFELFDSNPRLWCKKGVAQAVLATYTWCFMQFTLVFTATAKTVPDQANKKMTEAMKANQEESQRKVRKGREKKMPKYIRKLIKQKQQEKLAKFEREINKVYGSPIEAPKHKSAGYKRHTRYSLSEAVQGVVQVDKERKLEEEIIENVIKEKEKLRLHGDLYSILTLMLMQDGPFFVLRFVMIVWYRVQDETHLFFTGKNAMALSLLFYRLLVLLYEGKDDDKESEADVTQNPFALNDRESASSRQAFRVDKAMSPV